MISLRSTAFILRILFRRNLASKTVFAIRPRQNGHWMQWADSRVLLELESSQWAIGRPDFGSSFLHALECPLTYADGLLETFRCHGMGSIVAAAFHDRRWRNAGNFPQKVSAFEAHGLCAQVAWCVVRHFLTRRAAKICVEPRFISYRPKVLAWIHDCCCDLVCGGPVLRT